MAQDGVKYFIPGLPRSVRREDLHRYFSVFGQVLHAEEYEGAGYVTMAHDAPHSDIVTEKHDIGGKMLRALMSKESLQAPDVKKVHLGKLGEHVSADSIRSVLSRFGAVLDVHTPKDPKSGHRKNYGFATFDSDEAFNACISQGSIDIDGCDVQLKPANQTQLAPGEETPQSLRARKEAGIKYFVPGLPDAVTDSEMNSVFSRFGEVVDAGVVIDKDNGQSRGFGYVTMADRSSQEEILTSTHMLGGKGITVQLTKDSLAGGGVKKVHLGELSPDVSADEIREAFSRFGLVVDVHTPKFPDSGRRKNFGFVTFVSEDSFQKAVRAKRVKIMDTECSVKPAAQSLPGADDRDAGRDRRDGGRGSDRDRRDDRRDGRRDDRDRDMMPGGKGDWDSAADMAWGKAAGKAAFMEAMMWYKGMTMGKGMDPWSMMMMGPYGKGMDPWSMSAMAGKGPGAWDMWSGKGGGASGGDGFGAWGGGGKGCGKDPWEDKGAWGEFGKGGKDAWPDSGKGGKEAWGEKGGKDPWSDNGKGDNGKGDSGKGGKDWGGCGKKGDFAWGENGKGGEDWWGGKGDKGGGKGMDEWSKKGSQMSDPWGSKSGGDAWGGGEYGKGRASSAPSSRYDPY